MRAGATSVLPASPAASPGRLTGAPRPDMTETYCLPSSSLVIGVGSLHNGVYVILGQ